MKRTIQKRLLYCFIVLLSGDTAWAQKPAFKLGIETINASLMHKVCPHQEKDACAVGLITNQTGVDQQGRRSVDILNSRGIRVHSIFVPEHGMNGVLAERDVHDSIDTKTNTPVISLYGNGSGKMITADQMATIDCLIFDIQDSGMRHYTYISTMLNTMKIAAEYNKPYVVLDRPNPLGCVMEGPLVETSFVSFISIAPIPLRHGMTIGELAAYFNTHVLDKPAPLHVVKMKGYDRTVGYGGNLIQQLSPNLQSLQSVYGYSFLGLLGEIEPFDVGVGTPLAFRLIALPEVVQVPLGMWERLQVILNSYGVKSFLYTHENVKKKQLSKGLQLEFSDINRLHAFELFISIVQFFKKEGISFSFSASFNKAVGTARVQELVAGSLQPKLFFDQITHDLHGFYTKARRMFFYQPRPTIAMDKKIID